jgi:hypothetical protein
MCLSKVCVYLSRYLKYWVKKSPWIWWRRKKINSKTCNKNDTLKVKFQSFNQLTGAKQEFRISYSEHIEDMRRNILKPMYASHILDYTREYGNVHVEDNIEI